MISAMTIAELAAKMKCGKCGGKDVLYKVDRQGDTPGFARGYRLLFACLII
jgi:hypothetical protein